MLKLLCGMALLAGLCACGRDAEATCVRVSPAPSPIEGATQCHMEGKVTATVRGAVEFSKSGTYTLLVNEFYKGKLPQATWFASLAMALPEDFADRMKFRLGLDVAPGTYRGPGRYTLTAQKPSVEGLTSPLTSDGFVEISSFVAPDIGVYKYGILIEPCALVVREKLTSGSLRCPKLADDRGKEVSLVMRWEPAG